MSNIIENMKARNKVMEAKKFVWSIEELLSKVLKCYYKNKLMNFENANLSKRYDYLIDKIKDKYENLKRYSELPGFDIEVEINNLKIFKEKAKAEMEKIAIHENAFKGNKFVKCKRCDGKGGLDHYSYVHGGVCFACDGNCVVMSNSFKKHMSLIEDKKDDLPF